MARRTSPPRSLWAFWILVGGLIFLIRNVWDMGDSGFTNILTMLLTILAVLVGILWFVFRSAHPARVRYGTLAAVIGLLVVANYTVEVRGWSGAMVPMLGFKGGAAAVGGVGGDGAAAGIDVVSTTPYDFSGYLGSNRDLRIANVELARDWSTPPEQLWKQPIGAGWGGFAVVNGYAATLEERDGVELVTMYDVNSGQLMWAHEIGGSFEHVLGGRGPRSTPLIHDGVVYAMGVRGRLVALDGATGSVVWERDVLADYGVTLEEENTQVAYGRPTSPLVVGDRLIVPVGGSLARRVSVVAYDRLHGEVLWEGGNRQVSMASPALATLAGRSQLLIVNQDWVSGQDPETGAVLWEFEWPGTTAGDSNVSQAVAVPPDGVFISKGYGSGAALYRLVPEGDAFATELVWHNPGVLRTKITNVAMRDGYAYGLSEGILECVNVATGERAWKAGRYRHGQILLVGDVLLVLGEDGELTMVEATPDERNKVLGSFEAIDGHTWNTFALYGDIVVVRNGQEAAAYRLPLVSPLEWAAPDELPESPGS
jgi:outer membrane protein assembly factor BamB